MKAAGKIEAEREFHFIIIGIKELANVDRFFSNLTANLQIFFTLLLVLLKWNFLQDARFHYAFE